MKKGFTLIELLFTMAIVAVIAGIGITQMSGATDTAKLTAIKSELSEFCRANQKYYTEHFDFADSIADTGFVSNIDYATYNYDNSTTCSNGFKGFEVEASSSDIEGKVVLNGCNCTIDMSYTASLADFWAGNYTDDSVFDFSGCESGSYKNAGYVSSGMCKGNTINATDSTLEYIALNKEQVEKAESIQVESSNALKDFSNLSEANNLYFTKGSGADYGFALSTEDVSVLNNLSNTPSNLVVSSWTFSQNKLSSSSTICQNFSSINVYRPHALYDSLPVSYSSICN